MMRRSWLRRAIVFLVTLPFAAAPALASEQRVTGTATVFAGGFQVVDVQWTATVDRSTERYRLESGITLKGWLEWFIDFEARHSAEGVLRDREVQPETFATRGFLNDEERRTDVLFTDTGPTDVTVKPVDPPDVRDPVPPSALAGTIDPLSLFLRHAAFDSAEEVCSSPRPIFDGRRVVAITLEPLGWETLEASSEERFTGDAFKCGIRHEVLAGQYKGDWPGKGEPVEVSNIWIAKPEGSPLWQPVRFERSTGFGTVIAHLEAIEIIGEQTTKRLD
ncbi:MAG: DUF3108 domain-containing protein [Alphaproteobacteria bacterium]|nr:DUF3108 domain-containing protein [Alphaproteobacteria bacterium]